MSVHAEAILMSTYNILFYGEIYAKLSLNYQIPTLSNPVYANLYTAVSVWFQNKSWIQDQSARNLGVLILKPEAHGLQWLT